MPHALGDEGMEMLRAMKSALDPNGILNPGKLGFDSAFGDVPPAFAPIPPEFP